MLDSQKLEEIENWIDNRFGFYNYLGIRGFVKSAMDNTLKSEYPKNPYSAREILLWAKKNDEDSFFFTAGGQAIEGQTMWQDIAGTPVINPLTNKRNSKSDIDGAVVNFAKSGASTLFKVGMGLGIAFLVFRFADAKVKKLGSK